MTRSTNLSILNYTFALLAIGAPLAEAGSAVATKGQWGNRPLGFEENRGQADANVNYVANTRSLTLLTLPTGATFQLPGASVHMRLSGSGMRAKVQALDPLPGKVNYLSPGNP